MASLKVLQRFNTAVFRTLMPCTKRELRAAIFEAGETLIFWQEQFKDLKEDLFLKTVFPHMLLTCFLFKILTKKIHQHVKLSFLSTKQRSKCDSLLRNHVILHKVPYSVPNLEGCNASLSCVIHIKTNFWRCVVFIKVLDNHNSFCYFVSFSFLLQNVDPEETGPAYILIANWSIDSRKI